jgi:hypothetical protein
MELPHDREDREHLWCASRAPPPVPSAEGDLGNFLPSAEAVVGGTTRESFLSETVVDDAAEVRLQIGAGLPGLFVNREVCRG